MEQTILDIPKDKRDIRVTIKMNHADIKALESGMVKVGEVNVSSYIRQLIHSNK